MEPQTMPSALQLMGCQNPPYGRDGDGLDDGLSDELPGQLCAILLGETAAQDVWALAGQAYHVDGDLRGKKRPWPHGQGRHTAPQAAGRETP